MNTYTLVKTRQKAPGQRAEGKEESCKVEGDDNCLGGHDIRTIIPVLN
ncbi:MAG: hypothetical protein F6K41_23380 [Symploca sp. SIO3E6]|nr:hypothetical protein [Caldora sp. SIO3E6]